MALADRAAAGSLDDWVFFDRGLIDAAAALQHLTGAFWNRNFRQNQDFVAERWIRLEQTMPHFSQSHATVSTTPFPSATEVVELEASVFEPAKKPRHWQEIGGPQ
jgi:predicted ATPase